MDPTPLPSDLESTPADVLDPEMGTQSDIQSHRATLDGLLALLHDCGDAEAIRLCDDLGVPVDSARRGTVSRGDAARRARAMAATIG